MKLADQKITLRLSPCRCGCGGSDPWHAASLRRTIYDVTAEPARVKLKGSGLSAPQFCRRFGTVKLPWGSAVVGERGDYASDGRWLHFGWFVVA